MQLKHPDTRLLAVSGTLYLVAVIGFWLWLGPAGWVPSLTILYLLVMGLQLHLHRVREEQDGDQLRQIQALVSLHQLISFQAVSPWMTGWAATPEFAATLYDLVRDLKPSTVLELGSGASSVVVAAALAQNEGGRLISVDQKDDFARETQAMIQRHGLSAYAQVVHAPLTEVHIDDETWLWYDTGSIPIEAPIDLLIVDGPHRELQKLARYPAIPLLIEKLSADAVVVLDDAGRKDEQEIVRRWSSRHPEFDLRFLNSQKGIAIFSRTAAISSISRTVSTAEV